MIIRDETSADRDAIRIVVDTAFANHPHGNGREGELVDALREAGALTLSLVAEDADEIAGHVAISPVTIDGASDWHGLGPIAVLPARQRRGVGSALVEAALSRLRATGAAGCVVFGDPRFYGRFGFRASAPLRFPDGPPELFLALPFTTTVAAGAVRYHPAFTLVG